MLIFVLSAIYAGILYFAVIKPLFGESIERKVLKTMSRLIERIFESS